MTHVKKSELEVRERTLNAIFLNLGQARQTVRATRFLGITVADDRLFFFFSSSSPLKNKKNKNKRKVASINVAFESRLNCHTTADVSQYN